MASSVYVCFVIRKHDMFKTNQPTKKAEFSYGRGPHRVAVEQCKHSISDLLPQTRGATKPLFILQIQGRIIAACSLKMLRKPPELHGFAGLAPWRMQLLVRWRRGDLQSFGETLCSNPGQGSCLRLAAFSGKELSDLCPCIPVPACLFPASIHLGL